MIDISGPIEFLDLFLKDRENRAGGITGLKLCGECICFQDVVENLLEVRGRGGSCLGVIARHV